MPKQVPKLYSMPPTQNICILAIDDTAINLFLIEQLIKKICPEAKVLKSENGEDGILKFKENKVDLIFLDIQLPTIDGFETALEIRKAEVDGSRTPIIALSGYEKEQLITNGDSKSMDDFLRKPIKMQSLEEIVNKFLAEEIKQSC